MAPHRKLLTLLDVPATQCQHMTREASKSFITTMFAEMGNGGDALNGADLRGRAERGGVLAFEVLAYRVAAAAPTLRFSYATARFLASISSTPAHCVLWAHYLVTRTRALGGALIDTGVLARDFPVGFPSDEGMEAIWDAQKVQPGDPAGPNDNCLDAAWPWLEAETA